MGGIDAIKKKLGIKKLNRRDKELKGIPASYCYRGGR